MFRVATFALSLLFLSPALHAQNAPVAGFGSSLQFDGSDDYAEINPYTSPTGDFTIEFWVKPIDLNGGYRGFFGLQPGGTTTRGPSMWQNGNAWHCDSYKKDGTRFEVEIQNVFQQANEWVHLAWVKNGGTYYYYRNGKQIDTRPAPPNGDYVTNTTLRFGRVDNYYNAFFDEVRIWTVARTVQEINEFRFRNLPSPLPANVLHYYPLDEGSGTTINDIGSARQNGTLINGPVFQTVAASTPPITTPEDTPVSSFVKGSDADGDVLTFQTGLTSPTKGSVLFDDPAIGAYTYTPNANATGADSFTYKIVDDENPARESAEATVNITITPVNDAPVSTAEHYHIGEDGTLTVPAPGVLEHDSDLDGDHLSIKTTSQPETNVSNGSLTLNQDGSFTYVPTANFNGSDSFTYKAFDGTAEAATAVTVDIRVDAVNDPPTGQADAYNVPEDGKFITFAAGGVLANDTDVDGNTLTATVQTDVSNGVLTLNVDGAFTYIPNPNFNGKDSFTYVANDGSVNSSPVQVTFTVSPTNDDPTPVADHYTVAEDGLLTVDAVKGLLANDTDLDGDTLRVELGNVALTTTSPSNGQLTKLAQDGSFQYTPNPNFNGADAFTYYVTDGSAVVGPTDVTITVTPTNDAPVAVDDTYSVPEDGFLDIRTSNLLSNDSDIDGNSLSAKEVTRPTNGALTLKTNGDFEYRPNANFNGRDSFTYTAFDGSADSNTATVNITVNAVNDAPVAQDNAYSVAQNGLLTVSVGKGLLSNATDADGNTLIAELGTSPQHGQLQFSLDGSFTYKHDGSNNFTDSFTYRASDRSLKSSEATVRITINPVNRAPLAGADKYTGTQDTQLSVPAPGILNNDLDLDGDSLFVVLLTSPSNGALSFKPDGSFSYFPARDFNGTDTFTYEAVDGSTNSSPTTVSININAVNTPPLGVNDSYNATSGQVLQIAAGNGLTSNDFDPEGQVLSVARIDTKPTSGVLQSNTDGSFKYYPFPNFIGGTDSFTYFVSDGADETGPVTVTLNYLATPNQIPVANDDSYAVPQGSLLTVAVGNGLLANDTDGDGNTLLSQLETGPVNGQLQLGLDGSFSYRHDGSNNLSDSFTYRANDGSALSNLATVNIAVSAVNRPPLPGSDNYSTTSGQVLQISAANGVLANDIDLDGDTLIVSRTGSGPSQGTLRLETSGAFVYTPSPSFIGGTDSFTYFVSDGAAEAGPVTVNLDYLATPRIRSFTGTLPSGNTGVLSFSTADPGCEFIGTPIFSAQIQPTPPAGVTPIDGLVSFVIGNCSPGATVDMALDYGQPLPANTGYWKAGTPWRQMPAVVVGTTMDFSITDGGPFDTDGAANGSIVDPSGAATLTLLPTQPVPVLPRSLFALLILLLTGAAVLRLKLRTY